MEASPIRRPRAPVSCRHIYTPHPAPPTRRILWHPNYDVTRILPVPRFAYWFAVCYCDSCLR